MYFYTLFSNLDHKWKLLIYLYVFLFIRRISKLLKINVIFIVIAGALIPGVVFLIPLFAFVELLIQITKFIKLFFGTNKAY